MGTSRLLRGDWNAVVSRIGSVVDLESTARRFGALRRVRKVRSAEALLRLALMYGPGRQSLRSSAALASDGGIADLSDKAVEGRLRKMGDWLSHLLGCLLAERHGLTEAASELEIALVDGSVVCSPGQAARWRLHARYDPGRGRFADLRLSDAGQAERVAQTHIAAGQTIVTDRGYARVRDFQAVLAAGADFITRIGWRSLALREATGEALDLVALLSQGGERQERVVRVVGVERALRLVIQRLPQAAASRQQQRRARKSGKAGHRLDPRTTLAAGYVMLLTSLDEAAAPAARVLELYRQRWQIEIGFKRLKTLGGLDALPASDPRLARSWLLAQLIAAVLTEEMAREIAGFPPSAQHRGAAVARLEDGTRHSATRHPASAQDAHTA